MIADNLQKLSDTIAKLNRKDITGNARSRFLTQYAKIADVYTVLPPIERDQTTTYNFNLACDAIMKLVPPTVEITNASDMERSHTIEHTGDVITPEIAGKAESPAVNNSTPEAELSDAIDAAGDTIPYSVGYKLAGRFAPLFTRGAPYVEGRESEHSSPRRVANKLADHTISIYENHNTLVLNPTFHDNSINLKHIGEVSVPDKANGKFVTFTIHMDPGQKGYSYRLYMSDSKDGEYTPITNSEDGEYNPITDSIHFMELVPPTNGDSNGDKIPDVEGDGDGGEFMVAGDWQ